MKARMAALYTRAAVKLGGNESLQGLSGHENDSNFESEHANLLEVVPSPLIISSEDGTWNVIKPLTPWHHVESFLFFFPCEFNIRSRSLAIQTRADPDFLLQRPTSSPLKQHPLPHSLPAAHLQPHSKCLLLPASRMTPTPSCRFSSPLIPI